MEERRLRDQLKETSFNPGRTMNAVFNRTISPEKKIPKFGQFYFDSCLARGKFFCLETGMSTAYETIKTSDRCLLCRRVMTWEQWLDREQQCRPCPSLCQEGPAAVSQSRPVCLGLLVGVGPSLGTLSSHPKFFQSTWRTSFSPQPSSSARSSRCGDNFQARTKTVSQFLCWFFWRIFSFESP